MDQTASLDGHVKSVCKSALFHLRNIAKIREYLNVESTKSLLKHVKAWIEANLHKI